MNLLLKALMIVATLAPLAAGFSAVLKPPVRSSLTTTSSSRRDWLGGATAGAGVLAAVGAAPAVRAQSSPVVFGDESLMAPKAHGTTEAAVQVRACVLWDFVGFCELYNTVRFLRGCCTSSCTGVR